MDKSGEVDEVVAISGHPLLKQAALDAVRGWRFRPMADGSQFEVVCSFGFSGKPVDYLSEVMEQSSVVGPQHIQVLSDKMSMQTAYAHLGS